MNNDNTTTIALSLEEALDRIERDGEILVRMNNDNTTTIALSLEEALDRIERDGEMRDTLRTALREIADSGKDLRFVRSELKHADARIAELEAENQTLTYNTNTLTATNAELKDKIERWRPLLNLGVGA